MEISVAFATLQRSVADCPCSILLGSAVKLSGVRGDETSAHVPRLGENTEEVLSRIGIGGDEIERLRRDGVV